MTHENSANKRIHKYRLSTAFVLLLLCPFHTNGGSTYDGKNTTRIDRNNPRRYVLVKYDVMGAPKSMRMKTSRQLRTIQSQSL